MTVKYTKWTQKIRNGRKIYQRAKNRPSSSIEKKPTKFTQIDIFGLKLYYLATLSKEM
jgi:transcription initiation factor TFIID subunit TAF12